MKTWEKGYTLHPKIEDYTVGNDFILDKRLVEYDCIASIAHAKMLGKMGILNSVEVQQLVEVLGEIILVDKKGDFLIKKEDEDCHTAIENYLISKLGDTGKKIHTARSRNDQVLTALRLYYKDEITKILKMSTLFIKKVRSFIKKYGDVQFPGYTHTRKAMPSNVKLWCEAYIYSMKDNIALLEFVHSIIDRSPLGTGAGYGIPIEVDREFTAELLGFAGVQHNSIYTQISRGKFEQSILHAFTQIMYDLNRLASDLIFFSLPDLGYFELPDSLCTGSSIMPQKRNPDVLELMRGYYHVVLSCEHQVKTLSANLLSGYNRDVQLSKEPVMRSFDITIKSLDIGGLLFENIKVNKHNCDKALTPDLYATEEVYNLVKEGMPFREAYKKVAGNLSV